MSLEDFQILDNEPLDNSIIKRVSLNSIIVSSFCFILKNENNQIKSFNGQSNTFRLAIKEIQKFHIMNAENINKTRITFK